MQGLMRTLVEEIVWNIHSYMRASHRVWAKSIRKEQFGATYEIIKWTISNLSFKSVNAQLNYLVTAHKNFNLFVIKGPSLPLSFFSFQRSAAGANVVLDELISSHLSASMSSVEDPPASASSSSSTSAAAAAAAASAASDQVDHSHNFKSLKAHKLVSNLSVATSMPDAFRADLSTSGDDDNDVNDDDDRGGDTSLRQNRNRRKSSEDSNHSHGKTEKVNDH